MMLEDGATASGSVTTVQRVGDTVRRPVGHWTSGVHALLGHLEKVGFLGAPRALGIDEWGREILSFLNGAVAMRPWPPFLRTDEGLLTLGTWLRDYHEAVRGFVPPPDTEWYVPDLRWKLGQIIRHGDLGPWNSIWDQATLVGFIDWDFAEPGEPIDDIAQLAWYAVPLRGEEQCRLSGFEEMPDLKARLNLLCAVCGVTPSAVLDALVNLQQREAERTIELGERGIAPWTDFLASNDPQKIAVEQQWLAENREWLLY